MNIGSHAVLTSTGSWEGVVSARHDRNAHTRVWTVAREDVVVPCVPGPYSHDVTEGARSCGSRSWCRWDTGMPDSSLERTRTEDRLKFA